MNKNIILLIIGSLLLLSACSQGTTNVVSVQGTATIKATPDEAQFYANVQTLEDTAEEAQTENTQLSEDIIKALQEAGIPSEDIETTNYNVYRREDWTDKGSIFKGYQADHTLEVTTVGKYIDIAVHNGATQITSVNFELSEEQQKDVFNQALEQAGQETREKAETLDRKSVV